MAAKQSLGYEDLQQVVIAYRDALRAHQERLNRLNVYPVPDGDTGTNMALTLESVVIRMEDAADMSATCAAISHGSLMGARGNSGVILSQILRGLSGGINRDDGAAAGAQTLADALSAASEAAYKSVMEPVEGTILTVLKDAAAGAVAASGRGADLVEMLDAAAEAARDSLARTPDLLPVLAEAGVIDAGGAGLVLLFDAFLAVVDNRPLPDAEEVAAGAGWGRGPISGEEGGVGAPPGKGKHDGAGWGRGPISGEEGGVGAPPGKGKHGPRYEVMYFLEAPDDGIDSFKKAWEEVGSSIVVVGGDGLWNCHIHTDEIGAAVEAGIDAGRPREIRVTDLFEQIEHIEHDHCSPDEIQTGSVPAHTKTAVVAVGTGAGVGRILQSLGAQHVVTGGRSMNPSTEEILRAVEGTTSDEVVILPNDKNVIAVAEQVAAHATKPVRVVPTRGIPQGIAALVDFDPDSGADANAEAMGSASGRVAWGEVTHAVRDAAFDGRTVNEGDWLGLATDEIVVVDSDLEAATCALLGHLIGDGHELVTLVVGDGVDQAVTDAIAGWISAHRPGLELEVHDGGQPLSAYLISVE